MTIAAIGPAAIPAIPAVTAPAPSAASTPSDSFAAALGHGLGQLQQTQTTSDNLAVQAATGDLNDVHDYMIASTEASLATQLTVAVRNKAVDAFNEIMRMQA
jgi:flagellar hook-basal body complex protein FliE